MMRGVEGLILFIKQKQAILPNDIVQKFGGQ